MTRQMLLSTAVAAISFLWAADSACAQNADQRTEPRMVYQGMSIVDPSTLSVLPDAYILIEEGRIAGLGQGGLPDGWRTAPLQNMSGLYAMAGLIDTHAHITLGPAELVIEDDQPKLNAPYRPDIISHNAAALLAAGVTTVRNPAGDGEANRLYAQTVASDPTFGPEARYAGEVIDRPAFPFEGLVAQPTPDLSVRDIVNRQAEAGAHFIKLYENLTEDDLIEGIAAARAYPSQGR